jgi:hypothetical protein
MVPPETGPDAQKQKPSAEPDDGPLSSRKPAGRRRLLGGIGGALIAWLVFRFAILPAIPGWLTARDAPLPSDAAIALGGDYSGSREAGAARLWREGRVRWVICSGRDLLWHVNEADAMAAHVRSLGVPAARILRSRAGENTADEAAHILAIVRAHDMHSVLLVTTATHSRRARMLFRRAWSHALNRVPPEGRVERRGNPGTGIRILACPVESPYFRRERWWTRVRDRHVIIVELLSWVRVVIGR